MPVETSIEAVIEALIVAVLVEAAVVALPVDNGRSVEGLETSVDSAFVRVEPSEIW